MKNNLKGELAVMDSLDIKPNYAAPGRKYGMDWRTVKKYHNGYEGRPDKRNKGSKLDEYRNEIKDILAIKRITVQGGISVHVKKIWCKPNRFIFKLQQICHCQQTET